METSDTWLGKCSEEAEIGSYLPIHLMAVWGILDHEYLPT
jgi:hypothetical protein